METKNYCAVRHSTPKNLPAGLGAERAALIFSTAQKWANGTLLKYYFFDSPTDGSQLETGQWISWKGTPGQLNRVREGFRIWKAVGIGLDFKEVFTREEAEIRIGFMQGDGSWSYVGRDILTQGVNERTMNFGWNVDTNFRANGIDTVLHEIGHTLGFNHEHQNYNAGIVWDEPAVYNYFSNGVNSWKHEMIFDNIIRKLQPALTKGTDWDPDSIMHYSFDPGLIKKPEGYYEAGLSPAGGLSPVDLAYVKKLYPEQSAAPLAMQVLQPFALTVANTEQQEFSFTPDETRYYNLRTFGPVDSVLVVFEINEAGEPQFISGDDNGGVEQDAAIRTKLFRGRKYVVKLRLYYKSPGRNASLMIW